MVKCCSITARPPRAAAAMGIRRSDYAVNNNRDNNRGVGPYKGVRMRKWGKWVAEVRLPNSRERIWLGSYETAEKAARAFDAAVFCIRGPSAKFNFPGTPPLDLLGERGNLTRSQIQVAASRYAHEAAVVQEAAQPDDQALPSTAMGQVSAAAAAAAATDTISSITATANTSLTITEPAVNNISFSNSWEGALEVMVPVLMQETSCMRPDVMAASNCFDEFIGCGNDDQHYIQPAADDHQGIINTSEVGEMLLGDVINIPSSSNVSGGGGDIAFYQSPVDQMPAGYWSY